MTINAWFDSDTKTYHIHFDGRRYTRKSYTGAKELIDSLLINLTAKTLYT